MRETDLAYLAGLIDADGCIIADLINRTDKTGGSVRIRIQIGTVSVLMVDRICEIWRSLDIDHSIVSEAPGKCKRTRWFHKVVVIKKSHVHRALKAISPYLSTKKSQADVLLNWLDEWGDTKLEAHKIPIKFRPRLVESLSQLKKIA